MGKVGRVHDLHERFLADAAKELREGHRIHEARRYAPDAKGGDFLKCEFKERTSGNHMEPRQLLLEVPQRGKCPGTRLSLVEKEQRLSWDDGCICVCGKFFGYGFC